MRLEVGVLVGDRFRLVARRAEGTLGELWCASDRAPRALVALRLLGDPRDATIAAALHATRRAAEVRHAALARVVEIAGADDRHGAWVATEWLQLDRLDAILARRAALLPGAALELIATLAEGLAEAHARGVAHGAIEPRAVALCRGQDARIAPKLLDLGLSGLRRTASDEAPARAPWDSPGPADDVFALGALLRTCVGAAADEPRLRALIDRCRHVDPRARLDAAALAAEARFTARRARGGFVDLARMARFEERAAESREPRLSHWPTLPGLGTHTAASTRAQERPIGEGAPWLAAMRALLAPPISSSTPSKAPSNAPTSTPPTTSLSPLTSRADRASRGRGLRVEAPRPTRPPANAARAASDATADPTVDDEEPSGCSFPSPAPSAAQDTSRRSIDRTTADALSALRGSSRARTPLVLAVAAAALLGAIALGGRDGRAARARRVAGANQETPARAAASDRAPEDAPEDARPSEAAVTAVAPAKSVVSPMAMTSTSSVPIDAASSTTSTTSATSTATQPVARAQRGPSAQGSSTTPTAAVSPTPPVPMKSPAPAEAMARIGNVTGVPLLDARALPTATPKANDAPYE